MIEMEQQARTLLHQAETVSEKLLEALKAGDEAQSAKLLEQRRVMFEKVDQINAEFNGGESRSESLSEETRAILMRIQELDKSSIEQGKAAQSQIVSELHKLNEWLKARKAYQGEPAYDPRFLDKLK